MKLFIGLPAVASLAVLVAACSSSSTPASDDAGSPEGGSSDGSTDATTDGTAACGLATVAASSVPTFTAPAIGQGVCPSADIAAFATACAAGASGAAPEPGCETWLQTEGATCRNCLLGTNDKIGVFDSVTFGGQQAIIPSLGACILGEVGSASVSACAAAAEPLDYCADYACAQCSGAAAAACVSAATSGACASFVTSVTGACSANISALVACKTSLGTSAALVQAATVICGTGEGGPSGEGGAGEAGTDDGGGEDAASNDASSDDAGAVDAGADSGATDSGVTDSGKSDSGDSGG